MPFKHVANPYLKKKIVAAAAPQPLVVAAAAPQQQENNANPQNKNMGPQSQRRISLQARTHRMQRANVGNNKKRKKGDQLTLQGTLCFDPFKDCAICKAKKYQLPIPHRPHHPQCWNNRKTKGLSPAALAQQKEDKRLKELFTTPLPVNERFSWKHSTKEAGQAFFTPRPTTKKPKANNNNKNNPSMAAVSPTTNMSAAPLSSADLCKAVTEKVYDSSFTKEHASSRSPLAMLAFASVVVDQIIRNKDRDIRSYFDGLTITVPKQRNGVMMTPQYHSIVGQKLLYVDWKKMFGLEIDCPKCHSEMVNDRTNFSKNKILFPIFDLDGPPLWVMAMSMKCTCCGNRMYANSGEILCNLPAYARAAYPVETKYAQSNKNCHIGKTATTVFDLLMPTYGNGELCSRLLFNAINRAYLDRVESYYAHYNDHPFKGMLPPYMEKDGEYIRAYPPLGDGVRDAYDLASSTDHNPWHISDHDRHTREIQGVACTVVFAQDHTHEVTKNYFTKKRMGANALWDVATETGEIACAVLVPTTKTKHFSHAAIRLAGRKHFNPSAMYSDTWPHKSQYWEDLFGSSLKGRLGLFHYLQRITRTLRKKHIDHYLAISELRNVVYRYNDQDYDNLLKALKTGTLSGTQYTEEDIVDMKSTKVFRQRYDKYLRKEIRPHNVLCSMLDAWFCRFKCTSSDSNARPALGRYDPLTGDSLFTSETKLAVENCKDKAKFLQDPLPLEEMYDVIEPSPNSPHQLREYLSRRGESCLESFHAMLAHFGNCGMRTSLADNLNLTGTARHNISIRHKLRLSKMSQSLDQQDSVLSQRKCIPAAFEGIVSYYNHTELAYVNQLAKNAGVTKLPFDYVEPLPEDNGERFFSEYLSWMRKTNPRYDALDRCCCNVCAPTPALQNAPPRQDAPATTNGTGDISVIGPETIQPSVEQEATPAAVHQRMPTQPLQQVREYPQQPNQLLQQQQPQPQPQPLQPYQPPFRNNNPFNNNPMPIPPWFGYQTLAFPLCMTNTTIQMPLFCCTRYQEWYNQPSRSRGRPPHDRKCRKIQRERLGQNEKVAD